MPVTWLVFNAFLTYWIFISGNSCEISYVRPVHLEMHVFQMLMQVLFLKVWSCPAWIQIVSEGIIKMIERYPWTSLRYHFTALFQNI